MSFTPFQSPDAAPAASAAPRARMWDALTSVDAPDVAGDSAAPSASATQTNVGGNPLPALVSCTVSQSSFCLTHCLPLSCAVRRLGPLVGLCAFVPPVIALS